MLRRRRQWYVWAPGTPLMLDKVHAADHVVLQTLSQAKSNPEYANYLTYILASQSPGALGMEQEQSDLARLAAAISLKNHVKARYKTIQPQSQAYIQTTVVQLIQDPHPQIRSYTGNIITEIVLQVGVFSWPEILMQLIGLADNDKGDTRPEVSEAASAALVKICEDNTRPLNVAHQNGTRATDYVIPKLIKLTQSPTPKVRANALEALNIFIPGKSPALLKNLNELGDQLFNRAMDEDNDVRRFVCRAMVQMLEVDPTKLMAQLGGLVTYMIGQQKSDDPQCALEAAEFWLAFSEQPELVGQLGPYLNDIIPVLLESIVYSEDEQAHHEAERDDAEEEDKAEDIKPVFAKGKGAKGGDSKREANGANGGEMTAELEDGELEEELEEGAGDPEDEWTLRKCSAAALDVLATRFHAPVFNICLPWLRAQFVNPEWPKREAAVLAIGAISEGCMQAVAPSLPELIPFLINLLSDTEPVVRKITCWTLGRYSRWAAFLPEDGKQQYYVPMMDGLLRRMLDSTKSVQEAAASAFSSLEEASGKHLLPYTQVIISQFVQCFNVYKDKNMYILYDCVQTLAENLGSDLAQPALIAPLMGTLMERFNRITDDNRELFPLLECLSYVAPALRDSFSPFAVSCFERCLRILHRSLEQEHAAKNSPWDRPDKDFRITTLDLLSSVIQALPAEKSTHLIENSQPAFVPLLLVSMQDEENDVRQSAFALLGDTAKFVYPCLKPSIAQIMPILVPTLDADALPDEVVDDNFAVINNACWSCGEIALLEQEGMAPHLNELYHRLEAIIMNPSVWPNVQENACIALGRLGIWNAATLAPRLKEFGQSFVMIMKLVEDTDEKRQAFLGLNRMILLNPQDFEPALVEYFIAAGKFCSLDFLGDAELKSTTTEVSFVLLVATVT